jgi:hypothetical protein
MSHGSVIVAVMFSKVTSNALLSNDWISTDQFIPSEDNHFISSIFSFLKLN